jgi:uncharacterized protein YabE (DUF348 family)
MKPISWFFIILVLTLALIGTMVVLTMHKTALLVINGQEYPVRFWGNRVSHAVAASDLSIYAGDQVQPPLSDPIREGQVVKISPASWLVVGVDGDIHQIWGNRSSPQDELEGIPVQLHPGDELRAAGETIDPLQPHAMPFPPSYQVLRASTIHLEIDGTQVIITSTAPTLGTALWDAGIQLRNADLLEPPQETWLNGQLIDARLVRSTSILIHFMDQEIPALVVADTVGEALSAAGLGLQGLDTSVPPEDAPLPSDGKIRVLHYEEETIVEREFLPFGLEYRPLGTLDLDNQQLIQTGEFGLLAKRLRILNLDGEEISREVEDEWVAKQPQPRVIGYGTRINLRTVDTPEGSVQYYRAVEAFATSYSPCRIGIEGKCSNRTASGATLQKGVIGVIRPWYNAMQGAQVYIPGYGFATIQDIGAGVPGQHWVDLGYSDDDWVSWSQVVTVYFLAPAPPNILYILD